MRSARHQVKERFYFADADLFDVLPLPVLHGDLKTALARPDSVVLTRRLALAYFGRDDVVGQTLETNNLYRLTVTAVLKDFPSNTHLDRDMFVAGNTSYAKLYAYDHQDTLLWANTYTYFTLKPGVSPVGLAARLKDISRRHWQGPNNLPDAYELIPLKDLHFRPHGDGEMKPRGHLDSLAALGGIAVAILAVACINFSGLVFAERNERIAEMALYRALGARRIDLAAQIVREAAVVNLFSAFLGLVIAERILPVLNATLGLDLALWAHPVSVLASTGLTAAVLIAASCIVPAIVISRPQTARSRAEAATMPWRGWVIAQLALVIVMLCAAQTMSRQWAYSTTEALGFNGDNVVMVKFCEDPGINAAFSRDVATVPGVVSAAPSWSAPTNDYVRPAWIRQPGRPLIALTRNSVTPSFFDVFGVRLLAGRNLAGTFLNPETPRTVLINLAAVRALGFATPQAAVGAEIDYYTDRTVMHSKVAGVVSNLRLSTVYEPMQPMIFDNYAKYFNLVSVRLAPGHVDETLRRIDALWRRDSYGSVPIERTFFHDYLMSQYHDLRQQITAFYIISGLAILLSTLGLTGLSIFLTRHQMQEMAIRRALGATFGDIFRQRFVPFIGPFLAANLVAWPVAWFSMASWLSAFAERVPLPWLSFLGAGLISVLFGLATIAVHAVVTLRDLPVSSLRSE